MDTCWLSRSSNLTKLSYKEVSNNLGPQRVWVNQNNLSFVWVASLACFCWLSSVTKFQTDKYKNTKVNKVVVVVTAHHSLIIFTYLWEIKIHAYYFFIYVDVILFSMPQIIKQHGNHLKASAAIMRLRLYSVLGLLPPKLYEGKSA